MLRAIKYIISLSVVELSATFNKQAHTFMRGLPLVFQVYAECRSGNWKWDSIVTDSIVTDGSGSKSLHVVALKDTPRCIFASVKAECKLAVSLQHARGSSGEGAS